MLVFTQNNTQNIELNLRNFRDVEKQPDFYEIFNLKDEINEKQKYDLIYKAQFPDFNCDVTYKVEGKKRLSERIIDHSRCDDKSQDICIRTCKNDRT